MLSEFEVQVLGRILPVSGNVVDVATSPTPAITHLQQLAPRLTYQQLPPESPLDPSLSLRRISLLNLEPAPPDHGVIAILRTAIGYLRGKRIDAIRFTYGPQTRACGESLFDLSAFLVPFGFALMRVRDTSRIARVHAGTDDYVPSPLFAISTRLIPRLLDGEMPNMRQVIAPYFNRYGIQPRGVVHVGAHHGEEFKLYKQTGFKRVLFVEANPALAEKLKTSLANEPSVTVAHCAASNQDGQATLHITSMDESSSILPLKYHKDLYPSIQESGTVTVPTRKLDTLLSELGLSPADFNVLHLDIQGAEVLALQGATGLLEHIDAIVTEVNFEEVYEGCGLFDDLDDLLTARDFAAHLVYCPFAASWGDALYIHNRLIQRQKRNPADPHTPILAMSTLGQNGRYGNQLFQYAFLRLVAHVHGLRPHYPPWIGQYLFGQQGVPLPPPVPPSARLTPIFEGRDIADAVFPSVILDSPAPANVDLWGYFQFDMAHYAPYKDFLRGLFQPAPSLREQLEPALERLRGPDSDLVALHIRRGDYTPTGLFFAAPSAWYLAWLEQLWPTLKYPRLYIATDEPGTVLPEFARFNPLSARDLGVELPRAPFYPDFYVLSQADHVAISNSSFSFFATLLNQRGNTFMRPNQLLSRLVAYDPWNASPLLSRELGTPIPYPKEVSQPAAVQQVGRTTGGAPVISFRKPS